MKDITTRFLKSNYSSFEEFYNEEIVSTGFAPSDRPENALDVTKIDDEEDEE